MKFYLLFLSFVSGSLGGFLQGRAACNADNCARAVTGTRFAPSVQASHTADCSSFMIHTITPATPTVTATSDVYSFIGPNQKRNPDILNGPAIAVRQATQIPSNVPAYASACSGTSRYSSACSCAGITPTTTYAPTPATYTASTTTSTIGVCDPNQNFGFLHSGNIFYETPIYNGAGAIGLQACCELCYQPGSGCLVVGYYNGECTLIIADTTTPNSPPSEYCPYGVFPLRFFEGLGPPRYGLGPCGTQV